MGDLAWDRISPYAIFNGRHHIAKLLVRGVPGYLLWLDGRMQHQCFATAAAAKEYAEATDAAPNPHGVEVHEAERQDSAR